MFYAFFAQGCRHIIPCNLAVLDTDLFGHIKVHSFGGAGYVTLELKVLNSPAQCVEWVTGATTLTPSEKHTKLMQEIQQNCCSAMAAINQIPEHNDTDGFVDKVSEFIQEINSLVTT